MKKLIILIGIFILAFSSIQAQRVPSINFHVTGKTYRVNNLVSKDGTIYKCILLTTTTPPNVTYWVEASSGGAETDPIYTAWDKSTGITIAESQVTGLVSDLATYETIAPRLGSINSGVYTPLVADAGKRINLSGTTAAILFDDALLTPPYKISMVNDTGGDVFMAKQTGDLSVQDLPIVLEDGHQVFAALDATNYWNFSIVSTASIRAVATTIEVTTGTIDDKFISPLALDGSSPSFVDVSVSGNVDGVDVSVLNTGVGVLSTLIADLPVANLADGTDGELITWDVAGAPTTVSVGTASHVLTSNGPGTAPTFQASTGDGGTVATTVEVDAGTDNTKFISPLALDGSSPTFVNPTVTNEAYNATTWNGVLEVPTKDAVRDELEAVRLYAAPKYLTVYNESAGFTITSSESWKYHNFDTNTGVRSVFIRLNADFAVDIGTQLWVHQDNQYPITIEKTNAGDAITITCEDGCVTSETRRTGWLIKTGTDEWDFILYGQDVIEEFVAEVDLSDLTTVLTTGTTVNYWDAPFSLTLTKIKLTTLIAPTGTSILVDVNKNGNTIYITQGNRPSTAGNETGAAPVPDTTYLAEEDRLKFDIDQVGTLNKGLKVKIYYTIN